MRRNRQIKKIILCADDYAISPAVSRGIRELIAVKRLSATSVMTITPFWQAEGSLLRKIAVDCQVGLHITLTDFKPLTNIPIFTNKDGKMFNLKKLLLLSYLRKLPLDAIELEITAQIEEFIRVYGKAPAHLDGHQHIHVLPGIRDVLLKLYKKYFKDKGTFVRSCYNSSLTTYLLKNCHLLNLKKFSTNLKLLIINIISKPMYFDLILNSIPTNEQFSGVYDFKLNKVPYKDVFLHILENAKDKQLIMCHPGFVDDELIRSDAITDQRQKELEFFLSTDFAKMLQDKGLQLV